MTKEQIKAEHDRLRPVVFEGAPDETTHAAMDKSGQWSAYELIDDGEWLPDLSHAMWFICKNQPETTLDWRDTLIERGEA